MPGAYSIRIFLPNGEPNGLRILSRPNWTGTGVTFARTGFQEATKRKELSQAGVYVLVGNSEDSTLPTIYIGEGDPVLGRLKSHNLNKDFWNWAVVFTTTDNSLNKAHIKHLESRLVELAKDRKRCNLENGNQPQPPTLIESELADMESFLGYMLGVFPLIGIDIFESAKSTGKAKSKDMFSLKGRDGIFAKAVQNPSGFIVLKDSTAAPGTTPSISKSIKAFREDLIRQGVLLKNGELYTFTQDYTFSSPSMASSVTLGRNTNGRSIWKDKSGKSLNDLAAESTDCDPQDEKSA